MLNFKAELQVCAKLYDINKDVIEIPDSNVEIRNYKFNSQIIPKYNDNGVISGDLYYHELTQKNFIENKEFIYPVMVPKGEKLFSNAILFFHGLNERSWDKYFVWAKYLAEKTNRPVIMFPIAYHINRSPKYWSDPRTMSEVANSRRNDINNTTFVNAAISTRLEKNPERFLISGLQSYYDVIELVYNIQDGLHPLFYASAHFDIFSYSVGAFLSEILILNNFNGIFDNSKLFMFCGGCTFDSMNSISKYIMDEKASVSLQNFNDEKMLKRLRNGIFDIPKRMGFKNTWAAVTSMMKNHENRKNREKLLRKYAENIYAVALEKDTVIPAKNICETLKGKSGTIPIRVEVIDFPFSYSHEIPFPINDDKIQPLVNRSFSAVFDKAIAFYQGTHK